MPYTITTKDGITIRNIPDDVPPDSPQLKQRVAALRAEGGPPAAAAPQVQVPPPAAAPQATPPSPGGDSSASPGNNFGEEVGGALTRGLGPVASGALVGAGIGSVVPGIGTAIGAGLGAGSVAAGDLLTQSVNALFGTNVSTPSEAFDQLLTKAGIAKPETAAGRGLQSAAQAAAGAAGPIGIGGTLAKTGGAVARGVGGTLAAQPGAQIVGAAAGGASQQTAAELGAGPLGQLAAGLAGGAVGAKLATPRTVAPRTQALDDVAEAERQGIRTLTSDVAPPKTFVGKSVQSLGEKIPLAGVGNIRKAQQAERISAVKRLLRDFGADDAARVGDDVFKDLSANRAAQLSKFTGAKTDVIKRLSPAGDVPLPKASLAIDAEIAKLQSLKTEQVTPVIKTLQDWKQALQGQQLDNVEALRRQIGDAFTAPELSAVRSTGEKALSRIYTPLIEDMGDFIKARGEPKDFNQWKAANAKLAEMAGELKQRTLKSVLRDGEETPEVVEKLLFGQKKSDAKALYKGLTDEGRANARSAILQRAAQKAGGIDALSPDRFANEVKRLGASVGVFFNGEDLQRVKGLTRVIDLTKQAMVSAAHPPTGVQLNIPVGAAVLTDLLGGAGAGLASGAAIGGLARVIESKPVRNLLLKLPRTRPGSHEEAAIAKRLLSLTQMQSNDLTSALGADGGRQ